MNTLIRITCITYTIFLTFRCIENLFSSAEITGPGSDPLFRFCNNTYYIYLHVNNFNNFVYWSGRNANILARFEQAKEPQNQQKQHSCKW